jgi:hypothetical protein
MNRLLFIVLVVGFIGCSDEGPEFNNLVGDSWVINTETIKADFIIEDASNFGANMYLVAAGDFSLKETGGTVHDYNIFGSSSDVFPVNGRTIAALRIEDSNNSNNYLLLEDCTINKDFTKITASSYSFNISGVQFSEGLALSITRK